MSTTLVESKPLESGATVDLSQLFGAGRYSPLMRSVYTDAQTVFGLEPEQAEKLARAVSSDFGDAMKNVEVKASIGSKTTQDGKVTLKEAASRKGITITNALRAMQTLAWAADAGKFGLSFQFTNWKLTEDTEMAKYLAKL